MKLTINNDKVFKHKGIEHTIKACCGEPCSICEFADYIEFQCYGKGRRKLLVYGYDMLDEYPFWNLVVDNDLHGVIEIKNYV